ncbi:MAG: MOMP family protein [Simkaniaceae bacterium]|nr:MAG: MOMP family protein [Simkaniaceae bacterium]
MKVISLLSTAALTVCLTASGFCEEDSPQELDLRISQTEKQQVEALIVHDMNNGSSYQNNGRSSANDMMRSNGQTPQTPQDPNRVMDSVHGCVEEGFSLEAEFLWWRASLDNLEYAAKVNGSIDFNTGIFNLGGDFKLPDFKFDPGVRVSAGYDFGPKNWDLFARWTYHYTDPTSSTSRPTNSTDTFIIALKEFYAADNSQIEVVVDSARTKWKNQLNVLDLEMGYDYFFSNRFSFRPNFGLKAAWLDMDYDVNFGNANIGTNFLQPRFIDVQLRNKSDYWGVGPQVGLDGNLHMGWGFSLYSRVSGALLYGAYKTRLSQSDSEGSSFRLSNSSEYRQRAMAQIVAGIEWAKCFSNGVLLAFNLGWEGQYWWNQNEMRIIVDAQPTGDLTLTGLDAGIRLDF